jgi:hypothetical protein
MEPFGLREWLDAFRTVNWTVMKQEIHISGLFTPLETVANQAAGLENL